MCLKRFKMNNNIRIEQSDIENKHINVFFSTYVMGTVLMVSCVLGFHTLKCLTLGLRCSY